MPKGIYERAIASVSERISRHVLPEPNSGCWIWTGALHNGYGIMGSLGSVGTARAHRLSYVEHVGEIPAGMDLDHLCRVRSCVNPTHLQPVPRRINFLRGEHWAAEVVRTNTCQRGHSMSDAYRDARGWRVCRQCCLNRYHAKGYERRRDRMGSVERRKKGASYVIPV